MPLQKPRVIARFLQNPSQPRLSIAQIRSLCEPLFIQWSSRQEIMLLPRLMRCSKLCQGVIWRCLLIAGQRCVVFGCCITQPKQHKIHFGAWPA